MRTRRGTSIVVGLLALAASPLAAASGTVAASPSEVRAAEVLQRPAQVREYWTAERMREAIPAEVAPRPAQASGPAASAGPPSYVGPSPAGAVEVGRPRAGVAAPRSATDLSAESASAERRMYGKVFFTLDGLDYVCSGTVVSSPSHTLAWTAGHCVHGADVGGGFASNWAIVPGYRDGQRPYGTWPARTLMTTSGWESAANVRVDIGAAVLARDAQGRGVQDVLGARGIAFNQPRNQVFDAYGYPAEDPNTFLLPPDFDGERLFRCRSPRTADDSPSAPGGPETLQIDCDMTGGSSGGGWVIEDSFVNSVTSYGYQFESDRLYGPYFGDAAEELYLRAGGTPLLCAGTAVTNLGGGGADSFSGTEATDGFRLLAGADRAAGKAGNDALCGGGAADRLFGGPGNDRLRGGGGNDLLAGGPGRDVCDGGRGRDRAIGCEVKKRIP